MKVVEVCVYILLLTCEMHKTALGQYRQSDYILTYERTEITSYNTKYMNHLKARNFKYNRTQAVTNVTGEILVDFGYNLQVEVQAYKFVSNEYRPFPITFGFNYCSALAKDDYGMQNLYKCGNWSKCPMVKGKYIMCNFAPEQSHFPPFIPEGSYMVDMKHFYSSNEVYNMQCYGSIKKPIKIAP